MHAGSLARLTCKAEWNTAIMIVTTYSGGFHAMRNQNVQQQGGVCNGNKHLLNDTHFLDARTGMTGFTEGRNFLPYDEQYSWSSEASEHQTKGCWVKKRNHLTRCSWNNDLIKTASFEV